MRDIQRMRRVLALLEEANTELSKLESDNLVDPYGVSASIDAAIADATLAIEEATRKVSPPVPTRCDNCGGSIEEGRHCTDSEVCGHGDGPGFFLCDRLECVASYASEPPEERRRLFNLGRRANAIASPGRRPPASRGA